MLIISSFLPGCAQHFHHLHYGPGGQVLNPLFDQVLLLRLALLLVRGQHHHDLFIHTMACILFLLSGYCERHPAQTSLLSWKLCISVSASVDTCCVAVAVLGAITGRTGIVDSADLPVPRPSGVAAIWVPNLPSPSRLAPVQHPGHQWRHQPESQETRDVRRVQQCC